MESSLSRTCASSGRPTIPKARLRCSGTTWRLTASRIETGKARPLRRRPIRVTPASRADRGDSGVLVGPPQFRGGEAQLLAVLGHRPTRGRDLEVLLQNPGDVEVG